MNLNQLRTRCDRRLLDLQVPLSADPAVFFAALVRLRGRTIQVLLVTMTGGLSSLCVAGNETDYVFIDEVSNPWRRGNLLLHEVAHLLCEHVCERAFRPEAEAASRILLRGCFPHLDRDDVEEMLRRGHGVPLPEQEQEAELLATMLMQRVRRHPADNPPEHLDADDFHRLEALLARTPLDEP